MGQRGLFQKFDGVIGLNFQVYILILCDVTTTKSIHASKE